MLKGFLFSGVNCGIKSNKKDLGFILSNVPCVLSGVTTQNKVYAAPVKQCRALIANGVVDGVIVNSGNANAFTGEQGYQDCLAVTESACSFFERKNIAMSSTGIIGVPLPKEKIISGLGKLKQSLVSDIAVFAKAIMTTDLAPKYKNVTLNLAGHDIGISGVAKGSGMIEPNMATMLGYVCTDIKISSQDFDRILKDSVDKSFNMISVDTDTSTNDTVLSLANGESGVSYGDLSQEEKIIFESSFLEICIYLAKQIARDGEGATKLIEVNVDNVDSRENAVKIAKSVVNSPLVKTAVYGADPNWGRIVMAIGKTAIENLDQDKIRLDICGYNIIADGQLKNIDLNLVKKHLQQSEVDINISIYTGDQSATAWGCDLTERYIDINTDYN